MNTLRSPSLWLAASLAIGGCAGGRTGDLTRLQPGKATSCDSSPAATPATVPGPFVAREKRRDALQQAVDQATQRANLPSAAQMRLDPDGARREAAARGGDAGHVEVLCLSGGGQNGAFGAGFLSGWSGAGRPQFSIVTGVSTGSLIATFAFIGPTKDAQLMAAYTDAGAGEPIFSMRPLVEIPFSDSLATRKGLEDRLNQMITPDLLLEVAACSQGRSLLVGTVNLDTGHMTFWNLARLAEIAAGDRSKMNDAVELYKTILTAATAIPGALPPVLIDRDRYRYFFEDTANACKALVAPDWRDGASLHCDGGTRQNIFATDLTSALLDVKDASGQPAVNLYLIANGTISDDSQFVSRNLRAIAVRSVDVLLTEAMRGNLATIALLGSQMGWTMKFAYISACPECEAALDACRKAQGGLVDGFCAEYIARLIAEGKRRGAAADDNGRWDDLGTFLGVKLPSGTSR